MLKNNQNPEDFNDVDGLSITENDDGTFQVEWDENDPRYSIFKGLSEEQINTMIITFSPAFDQHNDHHKYTCF